METSNVGSVNRSSVQRLTAAAAAVAIALVAAATPARAQYRVGSDGHANDLNNRIGSGGYNSGSDLAGRAASNGQIVTGNVSGLAYFHGNANGEFDSNVFQGGVGNGSVNSFTQISAPVNYAARTTGASIYTPYYNGQSYAGAQSASLVPTANGVGLIQAPTKSALTPDPGDVRLNNNNNNSPLDQNGFNLPTPGSVDQPGPVNNVGNPQVYANSSLYAVRQVDGSDQAQTQSGMFDQRYGNVGRPGVRMDASKIEQWRKEANTATTDDQSTNGTTNSADLNQMNNPGLTTPGQAGPNDKPGQPGDPNAMSGARAGGTAVTGSSVTGATVTGATVSAARVSSSINTPYSSQQNNLIIPANQQSKQIQELEKRFAANTPRPTLEQQTNQNNRVILALKAARDAKAKAAGGGAMDDKQTPADKGGSGSGSGGASGGPVGNGTMATSADKGGATTEQPKASGKSDLPSVVREPEPSANPDAPFVITSLATGIKAPGLSKLLRDAEGQMRSGQFGQSVDTYDMAAEVAPSNPFVPLGRGFAELGASYYGKAEADLTRAILTEPALLAAQYDLKGFLGADRLKFVQKDLADIGTTEQTARPYLLLAYIDHNVGADDTTVTAKDLDIAESRGANPKLVELMREAWNLKAAAK